MKKEKDWTDYFKFNFSENWSDFLNPIVELVKIGIMLFIVWKVYCFLGLIIISIFNPPLNKPKTFLEANENAVDSISLKVGLPLDSIQVELCFSENFYEGKYDYYLKSKENNPIYIGYGYLWRYNVKNSHVYNYTKDTVVYNRCLQLDLSE